MSYSWLITYPQIAVMTMHAYSVWLCKVNECANYSSVMPKCSHAFIHLLYLVSTKLNLQLMIQSFHLQHTPLITLLIIFHKIIVFMTPEIDLSWYIFRRRLLMWMLHLPSSTNFCWTIWLGCGNGHHINDTTWPIHFQSIEIHL